MILSGVFCQPKQLVDSTEGWIEPLKTLLKSDGQKQRMMWSVDKDDLWHWAFLYSRFGHLLGWDSLSLLCRELVDSELRLRVLGTDDSSVARGCSTSSGATGHACRRLCRTASQPCCFSTSQPCFVLLISPNTYRQVLYRDRQAENTGQMVKAEGYEKYVCYLDVVGKLHLLCKEMCSYCTQGQAQEQRVALTPGWIRPHSAGPEL